MKELGTNRPHDEARYRLMEWRGEWVTVEVSADLDVLKEKANANYPIGSCGDHWTIQCDMCDCPCTYYGCGYQIDRYRKWAK